MPFKRRTKSYSRKAISKRAGYGKRKRSLGKRVRFGGARSRGKGSYNKRPRTFKKKMVRSSKSSASSFREAVVRALATTNTNIFEESQRVTFNGGTKQSGFNYPVGGGAWATMYYPPDIMQDIIAQMREQIPTPVGTGVAGFNGGAPIDCYITGCSISQTVKSCYQFPIMGRWYCFTSRYDGQDYDPAQQYANDIANIQGSVASALGQPVTADLIGTTPFDFRSVCQTYKIRAMSKIFKLEPGATKVFKASSKKVLHVTPRFIGINACKQSKFFMFEFWGVPINDSVNKGNVNTSAGVVDIVGTISTNYQYRSIPNTYKVFNSNVGVVTTPSAISLSNIVVTTTPVNS